MKDEFKAVLIRELTEEENDLLAKVRKLTGKGQNSKALMEAARLYILLDKEVKGLRTEANKLREENNNIKYRLREYFQIQTTLKDFTKK
jgi:uncharacterized protein YoxC